MKIAVDFDGTCVSHEFPEIGKDIGAVPVLKKLVENGHKLILYTMRSNIVKPISKEQDIIGVGGEHLSKAIDWFTDNGIPLTSVNVDFDQRKWTQSPKCYAHLYIDDAALGIPLKTDKSICDRPFVDWEKVEILLKEKGIL